MTARAYARAPKAPALGPDLATAGVWYSRLRLVREAEPVAEARVRVRAPRDVYDLLAPRYAQEPAEVFVLVALDSQSAVLEVVEVSRGILNGSLVHPREVFRAAIVAGAVGIIVAHNHPSGDPTPSPDDRGVTRQLVEAGRIVGIPVYDHIVCGAGRYTSFSEAGMM